jgi:hypothetical protein
MSRAWMAEIEERNTERLEGVINNLWGFQRENNLDESEGHASFVLVEDAAISLKSGVVTEIRDGVGINRKWGTAADRQKYDRATIPQGQHFHPLEMCFHWKCVFKRADKTAIEIVLWVQDKLYFAVVG